MQRLRHVHQLAMSYLVYPSATHRRFEHSLGVMELATRIYETVTAKEHRHPEIAALLPELADDDKVRYWRTVVRMAALFHDVGHLPFSHAGEDLLPEGKSHEDLTQQVIESAEMVDIWKHLPLHPDPVDISKIALGPEKFDGKLTDWERIVSEIVTGDVLGADRMDYLLRDAHHTGVTYGHYDHLRLLDGIRILPQPGESGGSDEGNSGGTVTPALGIEQGTIAAAESLLLARQSMYTQVYHHHVRLAYNRHLQDFLKGWLPGGRFKMDIEEHLGRNDNHVLVAMEEAAGDDSPAGKAAERILKRKHFKRVYTVTPKDRNLEEPLTSVDAMEVLEKGLSNQLGAENIRTFRKSVRGGHLDFPVLIQDGSVLSSLKISEILTNLPEPMIEIIFVEPGLRKEALAWIEKNQASLLPG